MNKESLNITLDELKARFNDYLHHVELRVIIIAHLLYRLEH